MKWLLRRTCKKADYSRRSVDIDSSCIGSTGGLLGSWKEHRGKWRYNLMGNEEGGNRTNSSVMRWFDASSSLKR